MRGCRKRYVARLQAHPTVRAKGYLKFLNILPPEVLSVIYWDDVERSAAILGVCVLVLLVSTLSLNTFIEVISLLLLSVIVVSTIIKVVTDFFKINNPFSDYLLQPITLPKKVILEWTEYVVGKLECYVNTLVLFDNIKALKFGVALWLFINVLYYLDIRIILLIVIILLFFIPPLYEQFQTQIDTHMDDALTKGRKLFDKVRSVIPYLGKPKVE